MPASIKLQEELGDDVQVIFVESQGASRDKTAAFVLRRKWIGTSAMWTDERPADSKSRALPSFVLLGNKGQVLMRGNPLAKKKRIEEAIAEQIALARKAPEGTPSKLEQAWSELGRGNLAKALAEAERVKQGAGDDELRSAAETALEVFKRRADASIRRVTAMIETGDYAHAENLLEEVARAVKGSAELEARVGEVRASLESDDLATEREAAAALAKVEESMAGEGGPREQLPSLEKLAQKYADTAAGGRARRYVSLLEMKR